MEQNTFINNLHNNHHKNEGGVVQSRSLSLVSEVATVVPVEAIPAERLAGMHISRHLVSFHMKVTPLELHLRFVHRVKFRVKYMQKPFVYDLNIYLETPRVIEKIK